MFWNHSTIRLGSSRSRPTKRPVSNQTEAVTLSEPTRCGQEEPSLHCSQFFRQWPRCLIEGQNSGHTQWRTSGLPAVHLSAKFINSKARKKLTRVCSCPTTAGPFFFLINYCTKFPPTFSFCCFRKFEQHIFQVTYASIYYKIFKFYILKHSVAQKVFCPEDLSHLRMEGCILAGFIYGYRKKTSHWNWSNRLPHTLQKKKIALGLHPAWKSFSINRLFQEVVGDGEGWYKEKTCGTLTLALMNIFLSRN